LIFVVFIENIVSKISNIDDVCRLKIAYSIDWDMLETKKEHSYEKICPRQMVRAGI